MAVQARHFVGGVRCGVFGEAVCVVKGAVGDDVMPPQSD